MAKPEFRRRSVSSDGWSGSDILVLLPFDPDSYGSRVADIFSLPGSGDVSGDRFGPGLCPMDLFPRGSASETAREFLLKADARKLFPGARDPESALSGLFLYFSCLTEAHELLHRFATPDGYYWHGIMHRMEGDAYNAGYWFRRVGRHAVFPTLHREAGLLGYRQQSSEWDPFAFIGFCQASAQSRDEDLAKRVQLAEWQLLFDYCASASVISPAAARVAPR